MAAAKDRLDYQGMIERAMRSVVGSALSIVEAEGLPGAHHFYITFRTHGDGVVIPKSLLAKYPDEMTIVLQNKFWDLAVAEDGFVVTLTFNQRPERLSIPFAAVTRFVDPAVQFALQFDSAQPAEPATKASVPAVPAISPQKGAAAPAEPEPTPPPGANIVTLDTFRKK